MKKMIYGYIFSLAIIGEIVSDLIIKTYLSFFTKLKDGCSGNHLCKRTDLIGRKSIYFCFEFFISLCNSLNT